VRFEGQGSFLSDIEKLVAPLPDLPAAAAPPLNADDETDADESPTGAMSRPQGLTQLWTQPWPTRFQAKRRWVTLPRRHRLPEAEITLRR